MHIYLYDKSPDGILKANGYVRIVLNEEVAVVDNASAAKIHQILIRLKDGDIVPLNALAAIADADLNWRMRRIKSYSNQNLMFRVFR